MVGTKGARVGLYHAKITHIMWYTQFKRSILEGILTTHLSISGDGSSLGLPHEFSEYKPCNSPCNILRQAPTSHSRLGQVADRALEVLSLLSLLQEQNLDGMGMGWEWILELIIYIDIWGYMGV